MMKSLLAAALILFAVSTTLVQAVPVTYDNGNANQNWSDAGNFGGTSPVGNDVTFDDTASTTTGLGAGNVTNIVNGNFSIGTLTYLNDNGNALTPAGGGQTDTRAAQAPNFHTTQINAGQTLTVTNTLTIGQSNATGNAFIGTRVAFIDGGGAGTLTFNNNAANIIIDPESSWFQNPHVVQLDLSGLTNFNANANSILIGVAGATTSTLNLADTNDITANRIRVASGGWGTTGTLELGQTNVINTDLLDIAGTDLPPQHNGFTGIMDFRTGLVNPTVTLRAKDTINRIAAVRVGLGGRVNSSGTGHLDLRGGSVDALFDSVDVGIGYNTANGTGNFSLDEGIIDANSLRIGSSGSGTGNGNGIGIVNVEGGTLTVGAITMADKQGAGNALGTMNLSGGTLMASSIQRGAAGGTLAFNFNSGILANRTGTDLTIGSGVPISILSASAHEFQVEAGQSMTIHSNIGGAGTGDVNKTGAGTMLMLGTNSYTGDTNVSAGTIGGTGAAGSDFTIGAGATLAPGASAGTFLTADADLQSGSTLAIEIGGTTAGIGYDQLSAGGDVILDGDLVISFIDGFTPSISDVFTIITADSVTGQFSNVTFPGISYFDVVYLSDSVLLTNFSVPEPSSFMLLGLGIWGLMLQRRRRRKAAQVA